MKIQELLTRELVFDPLSSTRRNGFASARYDMELLDDLIRIVAKDKHDGPATFVPRFPRGFNLTPNPPGQAVALINCVRNFPAN